MWCYSRIKPPKDQPKRDASAELTDSEYNERLARARDAVEEARRLGREMDAVSPEQLRSRVR